MASLFRVRFEGYPLDICQRENQLSPSNHASKLQHYQIQKNTFYSILSPQHGHGIEARNYLSDNDSDVDLDNFSKVFEMFSLPKILSPMHATPRRRKPTDGDVHDCVDNNDQDAGTSKGLEKELSKDEDDVEPKNDQVMLSTLIKKFEKSFFALIHHSNSCGGLKLTS